MVLIPFLIIGPVFTVGCTQPDITRYTADQVIAVAQAYSPTLPEGLRKQPAINDKPAFSAEYMGEGVWMVKKYAVSNYTGGQSCLEKWHFYESNGKLEKLRD